VQFRWNEENCVKELCNYEQDVTTRTKVAYMIQTNGNHPRFEQKIVYSNHSILAENEENR
jgi:hypothetical protein